MFSDDALLKEDFDPIAFLKHTLHLPNVAAEHAKLQRCCDMLDGGIREAVADNYEQMLEEVDTTTRVVKETERLKSNVTTLSSALVRLHHTIEVPYDAIQATGTELRNATAALDTLRAVQKLLSAVSKLPEPNSKVVDIHRTARKIKEIDELLASDNLSGIHVVDKALAEVTALAAVTRSRAQEMLRSGLSSGRQTDIATALHTLSTLGVGARVVGNYLAEAKRDTLKALMAVDAQSISSEVAEQSDVGKAKELVFTLIEKSLNEVSSRCALVILLMKTVQKQQQQQLQSSSSSNATGFSSGADDTTAAFADYGSSVASQLIERLVKLGKKGNVNGVLVTEFPRYSRIIHKFAETNESLLIAGGQFTSAAGWQAKVVEDIERLFISHVAEKQRDKLQQIITKLNGLVPRQGGDTTAIDLSVDPSRPTVPSQASPIDTRPLVKVISADMTLGRQDPRLGSFYINTTTNTLTQLLERLKEGSSRVPLTFSPSAQLTIGQLFHISLCNLATSVYTEVSSVVSLTTGAVEVAGVTQCAESISKLRGVLDGLQSFIVAVTRNFLVNGGNTLWGAVKVFFNDGDVSSLETRVRAVLGRQLLFFIKGTPQYEANRLETTNALLLRAMSYYCMQREEEVGVERLKVLPTALSSLGTFERLPASTRAVFRALTLASSTKDATVVQTLPPLLQIACLFGMQPEGTGGLLFTAVKDSPDRLSNTMALFLSGSMNLETKSSFVQQIGDAVTGGSTGFSSAVQQQLASLVGKLMA